MTRTLEVFVDDVLAGRMTIEHDVVSRRSIVEFLYDHSWLSSPSSFPISPELPLVAGPQSPTLGRDLFGSFADTAPDSWGRQLQVFQRRRQRQSPSMTQVDSLLMVDDAQRQGALRFRDGKEFIGQPSPVAGIRDIASVMRAAQHFDEHGVPDPGDELLLGGGSSPGGARPKSWIRHSDGSIWLAKFPRTSDVFDEHGWEEVAMRMQRRAGIRVQPSSTLPMQRHRIFLTKRFDRDGRRRVPYMSMNTLLQLHQTGFGNPSYEEMAKAVARISANPEADARELFRRAALAATINNADDHMRNHGLVRGKGGWRLSPAFDVNPSRNLVSDTPLVQGGGAGDRDPKQLLDRAESFRMTNAQAKDMLEQVEWATKGWVEDAREIGIDDDEIDNRSVDFVGGTTPANHASSRSADSGDGSSVWVAPHTRRGKQVEGHWRRHPAR